MLKTKRSHPVWIPAGKDIEPNALATRTFGVADFDVPRNKGDGEPDTALLSIGNIIEKTRSLKL